MEIKVSVILPSLNVADYIDRAIESVTEQSLREVEIICVDAGSEDGTFEKILSFAERDSRIIAVQTRIRSYGFQVNLGIRMARGKYIAILETDDFVDGNAYGQLYFYAEKYRCDYVKADYLAFWTQDNGEIVYLNRKCFVDDALYDRVLRPAAHKEIATDDWYIWTGIYRKKFLEDKRIALSETAGAAFQDIGFLIKTTNAAARAMYIKERYYRYCIDRKNSSSNIGRSLEFSYREYAGNLQKEGTSRRYMQNLYNRMAKSLLCCYGDVEIGKENISAEKRKTYYDWFRKKLKSAMDDGLVSEETLHRELLVPLRKLLKDEKAYGEAAMDKRKEILHKIGIDNARAVVIFGCGNIGYETYMWLKRNGISPTAFTDNDDRLWETKLNAIPVIRPLALTDTLPDAIVLIANERYGAEIKTQLLEMGIRAANIYVMR